MAERLLAGQAGAWLSLVTDPEPSGVPHPLRTAMRAWSAISSGASHHLVLQDDAQLADCFLDRVRAAIELVPDAALALYANWNSRNGSMVRLGALAGVRLVRAANEYTPLVALVLPSEVAAGFESYARRHGRGWSDDITMQRYLRTCGVRTYLTVPNLVEHGDGASLARNDAHGLRRSACFSAPVPDSRPGGIGERLCAVDAIPFFKRGVPYCAVRIPMKGDQTWETVSCESYLRRLGVAAPRIGHLPDPISRGAWLTAFTMGVLHTGPVHREHDPILDLALGTLGPGGLCDSLPAARLMETAKEWKALAWAGLEAGLNHRRKTRAKRVRRPGILLTGGGRSPLTEFLARNLADNGLRVLSWDAEPIGQGHPGITVVPPGAGVRDVRRLLAADTAVVFLNGVTDLYGERPALRPAPRWDLLRGAIAAGAGKVVCCSAYTTVPGDEETPAAAAGAGEKVCRAISDESGVPMQVLRFGDLYGPGVLPRNPPGSFICQSLRGAPIEYPGRYIQLVHVNDMAGAIRAAVRSSSTAPTVNIGAMTPITLGELAETVTGLVKSVPTRSADAAQPSAVMRTGLMRSELGFQPKVSIADGIRSYAQWLAYDDVSWQWS